MIHGETRIVLRNPISGNIIKDVGSENTFQSSVIAKYLRNLGSANASVLTNNAVRANPPWEQFLGGVFLFKDAIDNTPAYMPAGNTMIGNGSFGVTNTGNPSELGSFNADESSPESIYTTASSIVQTYDYTTSQAIGKINCVCLTSRTGGYIGYGNAKSKIAASTKKLFFENQGYGELLSVCPQYSVDDTDNTNKKCVIGSNAYGVSYDGTTKKVQVKRYAVPLTQCSVFDGIEELRAAIDVSLLHYSYIGTYGFELAVSGGKIYMLPKQQLITNGSVYYYWEYNPANNTISEKSITNSTDKNLNPLYTGVTEDLIAFIYGTGSAIYLSIFNRSTGTHISDKQVSDTDSITGTYPRLADLPGGLGITWSQINQSMAIYDKENDTLYPINAIESDMDNRRIPDYYDSNADAMFACCRNYVKAFNNPLYLATINNQSTEIEKDASVTMKVVYTLQEA